MRYGILGGGLSALTVASELKADHEIVEKNPECGGLCRSISEKGFTFDMFGGHILYSKDKETMGWMLEQLGENKAERRRNNKVMVNGRIVKYPFENDLFHLRIADNMKCLYHYLFNKHSKTEPSNFLEWIYHIFGEGIAELYMVPYNEKIWKFPLVNMSLHWVQGRVPKPPRADVIKSAMGIPTEGYTHQLFFHYPKTGGIQSLTKALEKKAGRIITGFPITRVRKINNKWVISDGKATKVYDRLISTIPVTELIRCLDSVPKNVSHAAQSLKFNSLVTVLIGLKKPRLNDYTAIYLPARHVMPHRVCFMNNFSELSSEEGKFGVMAEYTTEPRYLDTHTDAELAERTVNDLAKEKILSKEDVIYTRVTREKYAYVVYDIDYQKNIKIVRDYVESLGIILCGRFAEFEYLNMDACVKNAMQLAKRLNDDKTGK